ncbi:hypothetical protein ABZ807_05525 [Micromonospora sp. NPDC047548]|uniref:hypothetical protein n=1 Tax=Micromonospora sp. NPDC047548 TaxID=3155624 RepID=UPI0033D7929B
MPDLPALRRYHWAGLLPSEREAMTQWVCSLGYDPKCIAVRFAVARNDAGRWAVHLTRLIPDADGRLRIDAATDDVVSRPVVVETDTATWPPFIRPGAAADQHQQRREPACRT